MKNHDNSYLYSPLIGNFLSWMLAFFLISLCEYINGHYAFVKGHGPVIIGLFVGVIWTTRLHAYREAERIEALKKTGGTLNHTKRFFIRGILAFLIALIPHLYGEGVNLNSVYMALFASAFMLATFWLIFDSILNYDRGKEIFYVSKWYGTSKIDLFFSRYNSPLFWLASKVLVFLLTLWAYEQSFKFIK